MDKRRTRHLVALIEGGPALRAQTIAALRAAAPRRRFCAFADIAAWDRDAAALETSVLILSVGSAPDDIWDSLHRAQDRPAPPAIAILAASCGADLVGRAMNCGASAVLPAGLAVEVIVRVVELLAAGGTFVPASAQPQDVAARPWAPAVELRTEIDACDGWRLDRQPLS
ncbi:hypothetical protein [Chelatococcus reniformis]|uniref:hypothetical protein n=1 Tax=Chelatococcus reniformis TaxID=1494448 RepID=UPI00166BDCB1|nr:hypothetical protein [Chelatococcus reniformis]